MSGLIISSPCSLALCQFTKYKHFLSGILILVIKSRFFACYLETPQPTKKPQKTRIYSKLLNVHSYHQSVYIPKSHIISKMTRKKEK